MRLSPGLIVCLLAACERAGDSQNPLGTGGNNEPAPTGPRAIADAGIATMPNDAAKVAVVVDAAVPKPAPKPPVKDSVAMLEADAKRFADLLTVDSPRGKDMDMAARRPIGVDLGRQIDDIRSGGNRVAIGGGGGRGVRGDGDPRVGTGGSIRVGTGGGPKIDGPGGDPKEKETGPMGRISVASKRSTDPDATSLTPEVVLAKIQSVYMAGIKRCYKNALRADPNLKGRLTITFSVLEFGGVSSPRATGMGAAVDDCIAAQMAGWRFPVAKDKDGEKTTASFEFGLQLVPE
jgi:hypothetical protein